MSTKTVQRRPRYIEKCDRVSPMNSSPAIAANKLFRLFHAKYNNLFLLTNSEIRKGLGFQHGRNIFESTHF